MLDQMNRNHGFLYLYLLSFYFPMMLDYQTMLHQQKYICVFYSYSCLFSKSF